LPQPPASRLAKVSRLPHIQVTRHKDWETNVNQESRDRMIAEQTAKLFDPSFGQFDLSSLRDLDHPAPEVFTPEDCHGLNRVIVSGSHQPESPGRELRSWVSRPRLSKPPCKRRSNRSNRFEVGTYMELGCCPQDQVAKAVPQHYVN
jgi:hypothetical protein